MFVKMTRHAALLMGKNSVDDEVELPRIPRKVESLLGAQMEAYAPLQFSQLTSPLQEIATYLGEIDPIGILDPDGNNNDEYLIEADASIWLLKLGNFNPETFWALWIYFFDSELSPFKSPSDELLLAMHGRITLLFESRLTEEEILNLRYEAQTPWMGASIAYTKFKAKVDWLKKRKQL